MIVTKHPKHGTLILGLKPRFFVIVGVIILVLIFAYLYSIGAFKDWQIQPSYYNSSVIGSGTSSVVIPFTILEGTEQPITVPIQVQAIVNIGSVATKCSSPSTCNVTFIAPRTSKTEYANISINVGGVNNGATKVITIEVTPDKTASLKLGVANNLFYIYNGTAITPSNTEIVAYAYDGDGTLVPDGTSVAFSASNGTLSSNSCTTYNGSCNVTYTPPQQANQFEVLGSSYNASSSASVRVAYPYISGEYSQISNDSLQEIAHSETCGFEYCAYYNYTLTGSVEVEFYIYNNLNQPVNGAQVSVQSSSCTTSVNGSCALEVNEYSSGIYNNENTAYNVAQNGGMFPYTPYQPSLSLSVLVNGATSTPVSLSCNAGISCSTNVH